MEELILKIAKPIQGEIVHFALALTGVLSTITCFVPKNSKVGKVLQFFTNKILSLKDKLIKK
jgi:hypothetical protein